MPQIAGQFGLVMAAMLRILCLRNALARLVCGDLVPSHIKNISDLLIVLSLCLHRLHRGICFELARCFFVYGTAQQIALVVYPHLDCRANFFAICVHVE